MRPVLPALALMPLALSLANLQAAPVQFESEIFPFLEKKCVECHRAPYKDKNGKVVKPKAGLRMDGAWAILAGSENGAVLTAGDAAKSELYLRVTLPPEDDDFMPPRGKADPLTATELDLFQRWINEGARFGDWEGNTEGKPKTPPTPPADAKAAPAAPRSEIQQLYHRLSEGLTPVAEEAREAVTAAGGRVLPLARTSPLLSVDFRLTAAEANDEDILSARGLAANIAHLDLSRTAATDAALALVRDTPRLVRLDLSNTGIGDEALKHLSGLKELRYLNLHGTAVTDAGLDQLQSLISLDAVYLWQSGVTEAGAKKLRNALPHARINSK
ncbi:MAG: hypothetical protein GXX91_13725 [Verrucomicrobiaceae bacterium]|nr:hypothetical protein [Verrucomicrobiaceae bacterium]